MRKCALAAAIVVALAALGTNTASDSKEGEKQQQPAAEKGQLSADFEWIPGRKRPDEQVTGIRQTYTLYEDGSIRLGHNGKKPEEYNWMVEKGGLSINYINPRWAFQWIKAGRLKGHNRKDGDARKTARLIAKSREDWRAFRQMWKRRWYKQQNNLSQARRAAKRRRRPRRTRRKSRDNARLRITGVVTENRGQTIQVPFMGQQTTSGTFLEVTAQVKNLTSSPIVPGACKLRDIQGRTYSENSFLSGFCSDTLQLSIQPGVTSPVTAVFEVPRNARPAAVGVQSGFMRPYRWHTIP